jgi:hypothetical protein
MKQLFFFISLIFLSLQSKAQEDLTCLDTYYHEILYKSSKSEPYEQLWLCQKSVLFCSNNEYAIFRSEQNVCDTIKIDSCLLQFQGVKYSTFSYAGHTRNCNFTVTYYFNKNGPTQDRYIVRIENLTIPLLWLIHINPNSL